MSGDHRRLAGEMVDACFDDGRLDKPKLTETVAELLELHEDAVLKAEENRRLAEASTRQSTELMASLRIRQNALDEVNRRRQLAEQTCKVGADAFERLLAAAREVVEAFDEESRADASRFLRSVLEQLANEQGQRDAKPLRLVQAKDAN